MRISLSCKMAQNLNPKDNGYTLKECREWFKCDHDGPACVNCPCLNVEVKTR